jgi:hypothetical protein
VVLYTDWGKGRNAVAHVLTIDGQRTEELSLHGKVVAIRDRLCLLMLAATLLAWSFPAVADQKDQSPETKQTVVRPKVHSRRLRNPGMGLILYGAHDPPPDAADVIYFHLVWHDIEPEPGKYTFDTDRYKAALKIAEKYDRLLAIRLVTSWQNCPTPIPQYLLDKGVRLFPRAPDRIQELADFYEPEWWHPAYIEAHKRLVKAYGEFLDGNPRVAWIDARYYGWWGEGHRYGSVEPWPKDVNLRQYCKDRIDEYVAAFKKTPLVLQTATDKDVPYPQGTAIDYGIEKGMWLRRDGFGAYLNQQESDLLLGAFPHSLIIAENAHYLRDYLPGDKIRNHLTKRMSNLDTIVDQMLAHHVNYFPLGWGYEDYKVLEQNRPDLLQRASLRTGYRFIVSEASWPATAAAGGSVKVATRWVNLAVGRLPFRYRPALFLKDAKGEVVITSLARDPDPTQWFEGGNYDVAFDVALPTGLPAGSYSLCTGLVDQNGTPRVALAIEGDDGQRRFELGQITVHGTTARF